MDCAYRSQALNAEYFFCFRILAGKDAGQNNNKLLRGLTADG
jgi:hypothetical protein